MANKSISVEREQALVEQILDELAPLVARQRQAIARDGCLRAVSSTHLHVLFLLVTAGPMTMGHLADLLDASLPNASGIIDRMVDRGLVERLRDDADRRVVLIMATPAGRAAVEEIDLVRRRQMGQLLALLTADEQQQALHVFRRLRAAAEQLDGDRPAHD